MVKIQTVVKVKNQTRFRLQMQKEELVKLKYLKQNIVNIIVIFVVVIVVV
jgi:hypothetical protein